MSIVDVGCKPPAPVEYLGDAVYVSFDGYHVILHLADTALSARPASPRPVIYLDPVVMAALFQYYKRVTNI